MKKPYLFIWTAVLVFLVFPQSVFAHTGLQASVPAKGETIRTDVTELQLTFNTVIEPMAVLTVTDAQGTKVPVDVETGERAMTGKLEAPLASGTYQVEWRIIGEDGHNIKGEYSFEVDKPAAEAAAGNSAPAEAPTIGQPAKTAPDSAAGSTPVTDQASGESQDQVDQAINAAESNAAPAAAEAVETTDDVASNAPSGAGSSKTTILTIVAILLVAGFGIGIARVMNKK